MRESLKNDFTKVLPMFAYTEAANGQISASKMNRAIRKGRKLIEKHSITVKPERSPRGASQEYRDFYNQREFNRWVDEAWMLIGQSDLYLRNWHEALSAFDMVLQIFPEKKVRFEAMLGMARAYIELGDLKNAGLSLDRYVTETEGEKLFYVEAMSTYAWYWIVQDEFAKALPYCKKAAQNADDKWQKVRWNFILGQLAQNTKDYGLAREAYEKVEKLNPDYEIAIHARIELALLDGGPENPPESRKILERYAGEFKNLDYRDQIYFAIAQTWFWEGDTLNGLTNLQLAAGYGGGNRTLSGEIYKHMADVYFRLGDYAAANAYYDSTLNALPKSYEGISDIQERKDKLEPLARSLSSVQYEDSVQRIAALPEDEREKFIEDLLVSMEQEKQQKSFQSEVDDAFFYRNFANRGNQTTDASGKWYFYNPTMVSLGKMEFEKRWGRRELEDNWRRANKDSHSDVNQGSNDGMMPSDPFKQLPPKRGGQPGGETEKQSTPSGSSDKESLLKGLPLTADALKTSNLKIQTSLFNAGHILAYNFDKHKEAIQKFRELLTRYPNTQFREQALMGIYMSCKARNDQMCMQHYGKVITDDYPESRFAEFIRDPQYFQKQKTRETEMNDLYVSAYNDFNNGAWSKVLSKTNQIIDQAYPALLPQAYLLNAAAYSQTGSDSGFKSDLQKIVKDYPGSEQAPVARHWLSLLD